MTLSSRRGAGPAGAAPTPTPIEMRRELRVRMRRQRLTVTARQRRIDARAVASGALRAGLLRAGSRIAIYAALPSELDSAPLIELARRHGCRVFVPRIDARRRGRRMRFVELHGTLRRNRLGILEPRGSRVIGARWLDLVLVPLVGFSRAGVRLGMGGGYYDRAFGWRRQRSVWFAPRLIGVGYAFQEIPELVGATHDVLLDMVLTERGLIDCRAARGTEW